MANCSSILLKFTEVQALATIALVIVTFLLVIVTWINERWFKIQIKSPSISFIYYRFIIPYLHGRKVDGIWIEGIDVYLINLKKLLAEKKPLDNELFPLLPTEADLYDKGNDLFIVASEQFRKMYFKVFWNLQNYDNLLRKFKNNYKTGIDNNDNVNEVKNLIIKTENIKKELLKIEKEILGKYTILPYQTSK